MIEWILLAIVIIIIIGLILVFNSLVSQKNIVKNAWAQIDVQLKKRTDLVPNLIETVKGYAKHEKSVFTEVTKARSALMNAQGVQEKANASNMLTGALKSLFAVSESYPDLKASANFMQLQEELTGIESKIAYARQFYNDSVMNFNTMIQVFPNNLIAGMLGFGKPEDYFEIEESERAVPKVSF